MKGEHSSVAILLLRFNTFLGNVILHIRRPTSYIFDNVSCHVSNLVIVSEVATGDVIDGGAEKANNYFPLLKDATSSV